MVEGEGSEQNYEPKGRHEDMRMLLESVINVLGRKLGKAVRRLLACPAVLASNHF